MIIMLLNMIQMELLAIILAVSYFAGANAAYRISGLSISANNIVNLISTGITLTPGAILVKLIDRYEKDEYTGRITF